MKKAIKIILFALLATTGSTFCMPPNHPFQPPQAPQTPPHQVLGATVPGAPRIRRSFSHGIVHAPPQPMFPQPAYQTLISFPSDTPPFQESYYIEIPYQVHSSFHQTLAPRY